MLSLFTCSIKNYTQAHIYRSGMVDNLAARLHSFLPKDIISEQWKLLGQEKDGSLLVCWIQNNNIAESITAIGHYDRKNDKFKVLHEFSKVENVVQATVNQSVSLLGYVTKNKIPDGEEGIYQAYITQLKLIDSRKTHDLNVNKCKQVRLQFLHREKEQYGIEKLLLFVHQEFITTWTVVLEDSDIENSLELKSEPLVGEFIWAQWDMTNQVLYHIHHRRVPVSLIMEDDNEIDNNKTVRSNPTLSGLQFHDDLPHETVLNIPLNLPQVSTSSNCGTYEDDVIPLRVHDCSLDLIVISDSKGMVCVCHHYLYRPVKASQQVINNTLNESNTVHFAYSVTLLHHSCVIHCVIPGIPWSNARIMRPTFAVYETDHMIVFVQGLFLHILEIGINHEPYCHVLAGPLTTITASHSYLVPLLDLEKHTNTFPGILTLDLPTLDLIKLTIPSDFLIDLFRKEHSVEVRLGILHYYLCHKIDMEILGELITIVGEKPRSLDVVRYMQEILVGGSYTLVQKNYSFDGLPLLTLLPVTTMDDCSNVEIKVNDFNITLSHEKLWNTSVMLLSPQQRLIPYNSDLWTKLWDNLSKNQGDKPRFKPSRIADKLLVSLACYQPEALSRSSTPMSPGGGLVMSAATIGDLNNRNKISDSCLPFAETETCTASKQEHVVSVNLRELSMHLLKYGTQTSTYNSQMGSCTTLHVHAMASKYVVAQLETSRILCQLLCKAANVNSCLEQERGFMLIDSLDEARRWLLFILLERYRCAIETTAFPAPQGFNSFFTYLGYRTLKYSMFLQYIQRSVFELQVDVSKIIMADIGDTKKEAVRKLALLSLLPRTRAKRLLNQWLHPISFMLRAREHAANILSGEICPSRGRTPQHRNHHNGSGLAAFPSADRLSPLDTFLDLLTAKASLTELDFGLLIEATVTSTEDFL